MAEAKKKEVAKVDEKSTALAAYDYGEDEGSGFEGTTAADISIPFLGILQSNSPQLSEPDDGGIEGAKAGMLINTVTDDLFGGKEGVTFVPAYIQHLFVEWVPRDNGGGMVGMHHIDSEVVQEAKKSSQSFGKYKTKDGNDLVETYYVYGLLNDEQLCVIAFTSTKISVFKNWNTKLNMFTLKTADGRKVRPPLFAHEVKITTVKQKNKKGEFYNYVLSPVNGTVANSLLEPGSEKLEAAKNVGEMVRDGLAKAAFESQNKAGRDEVAEAGSAGGAEGEEEIPF